LIKGFDISHYQTPPSLGKFKTARAAAYEFVAIKASEGTWRDQDFERNWQLAAQAGFPVRIAYHYAHPGMGSQSEAHAFLAAIRAAGGLRPGDNIAIDAEEGNGEVGAYIHDLLHKSADALGIAGPLVYTGNWFIQEHHLDDPHLAEHHLWDGVYNSGATFPAAVGPWRGHQVVIWQHSNKERVPGFGPIDGDLFGGTIHELAALGAGGTSMPSPHTGDDDLTSEQLLNLKRVPVWMARLHHENWPSDPNSQVNDIDVFARKIPDNLDFAGVITAIHQTFETNHQPSTAEMVAAIEAKIGSKV
jgi:GH25 family lysozyme M1 (1,4-beta-N-acetylmuramidase)